VAEEPRKGTVQLPRPARAARLARAARSEREPPEEKRGLEGGAAAREHARVAECRVAALLRAFLALVNRMHPVVEGVSAAAPARAVRLRMQLPPAPSDFGCSLRPAGKASGAARARSTAGAGRGGAGRDSMARSMRLLSIFFCVSSEMSSSPSGRDDERPDNFPPARAPQPQLPARFGAVKAADARARRRGGAEARRGEGTSS